MLDSFVSSWLRLLMFATPLLVGNISSANEAIAGEVSIVEWRGHRVLKLTGPINEGTEEKLAAQLDQAGALPYGLPVLLLDSPGGVVSEGLKISALLDRRPVHTVVPDGAKCASTCASIIFIAGKNRTVDVGGLLGQHSCSLDGQPNEACNEELSQHAVEHGVSHGSVKAFVTYVPPSDILWFTREDADGWGLTKYPGEELSGFEKSEPRVFEMLTGKTPAAQSAWRIDFRSDGFEAFLRPASDEQRELQLNIFCSENRRGRLFLGMEVHGPAERVRDAVVAMSVVTDKISWTDPKPSVSQRDERVSEIVTEIPAKSIKAFLVKSERLGVLVTLRKPLQPMTAKTLIDGSRQVLLFAANNCTRT